MLEITARSEKYVLYGSYDPKIAIGVDLDDVLRQTNREVLELYREHVDPQHELTLEDIRTWELAKVFTHAPVDIIRFAFDDHSEAVSTRPAPNARARQTLEELLRQGYHVVIVTSCLPKCVPPSLEWLRTHCIPYTAIFITQDKTLFDGLLVLDDAPHNLRALRDAHQREGHAKHVPLPICFSQPWNRDHWSGHRVCDMSCFTLWIGRFLVPFREDPTLSPVFTEGRERADLHACPCSPPASRGSEVGVSTE